MNPTHDPDRTVVIGAAREQPGNALALGTRMGEFEITGLVGEGGFGIVYLAHDHSLDRTVALKEYMPSDLARRTPGGAVSVKSQRHADTFGTGMRSFVNEARLLARFDHPSLVKVYRFWEANGTAYMVMPYYDGATLTETLRGLGGPPDESWLKALLSQVLDALEVIHAERCYHRDIAPDNILMLPEGTPVLLDFGAARRVIGDAAQALTVILKPGYAPIEQYAEDASMKQGPWTDLYALASVAHYAIMGRAPVPAVARVMSDPQAPLVQAAAGLYSDPFLSGLDAALSVRPEDRPINITEFRDALGFGPLQEHPALREYGSTLIPATTGRVGARAPAVRSTQPRSAVAAPAERTTHEPRSAGAAQPVTAAPVDASPEDAGLEKLLAGYIGPLARIIMARARKSAASREDLLRTLAQAIDNEEHRAAFLRAAGEPGSGKPARR